MTVSLDHCSWYTNNVNQVFIFPDIVIAVNVDRRKHPSYFHYSKASTHLVDWTRWYGKRSGKTNYTSSERHLWDRTSRLQVPAGPAYDHWVSCYPWMITEYISCFHLMKIIVTTELGIFLAVMLRHAIGAVLQKLRPLRMLRSPELVTTRSAWNRMVSAEYGVLLLNT